MISAKMKEGKEPSHHLPQGKILPHTWRPRMRYLPNLLLTLTLVLFSSTSTSAYPSISAAIDRFVSTLYPKGSHYFWVINNTTTESPEEMIVDLNTSVRNLPDDEPTESRFLLLVVEGELLAAQKIPLNANVDCQSDEEV